MYGRASTDEKGYTPKTSGSHNLNHSVELEALLDDGSRVTLKKAYHEVYKTVRGSAQEVMAGHTTDHFIDGVPVKESQFKDVLAGIYRDEELAKMLTMYDYFLSTMKPADRRRILIEVCGDIGDGDVYAAEPELEGLKDILKKPGGGSYSVADYAKIAAMEKTRIDRELDLIPAKIDEAQKAKPDLSGREADLENAAAMMEQYNAQIRELEAGLNAGTDAATMELRIRISNLEVQKAEGEAAYAGKFALERSVALDKAEKLKRDRNDAEYSMSQTERDIRRVQGDISRMEAQRTALLEEWRLENARQWQGSTVCPTCGQELPEEQVNAAREAFNTAKSQRLEEITRRGQSECSRDAIEAQKTRLAGLEDDARSLGDKIAGLEADIRAAEEAVPGQPPYSSTQECAAIDGEIASIRERIKEIEEGSTASDDGTRDRINGLRRKVQECMSLVTQIELAAKQDARIAELEGREKELGAAYELIRKGIHLCELYTRTKAALLDERINSRFRTLRFRLFVEQVNGGIQDDCEALIPCNGAMVPFKSANNAARINAGLEVIGTLTAHYGVELPVFIDNAESVTKFEGAGGMQLIRLIVSERDRTMRFEGGL
jgi:hypothetical protein